MILKEALRCGRLRTGAGMVCSNVLAKPLACPVCSQPALGVPIFPGSMPKTCPSTARLGGVYPKASGIPKRKVVVPVACTVSGLGEVGAPNRVVAPSVWAGK